MKTKLNLTISPKTKQEYRRIKSILMNKGYSLNSLTDSFCHYWKGENLVSVRRLIK